MASDQWKSKLESSHKEYLSLIISSLLGVQILASIRDPIVIGFDLPLYLILLNLLLTSVMILIWLGLRKRDVKPEASHPIVFAAVMLSSIKALGSVVGQADPLPFYLGVFIFALSLCYLSYFYLWLSAAIFIVSWSIVATYTLTIAEMVSALFAMAVGFALAHQVMGRRISSLVKIYQLQDRVETLESIIPMCASCKKTRNEAGEWKTVEQYLEDQEAGRQVSHGVCPDCSELLYGDYVSMRKKRRKKK